MSQHPDDRRPPLSRREFLRRAGMTGIALPSMAAILAACGSNNNNNAGGGGPSPSGGLQLARPDNPVTLPVTDDNPAIADGMQPEAGPLKIFGYNDYIWKKIRNKFTDAYGADVEYTVFDTPEEMVQKMQSSGSSFDLIATVTIENVGKLAFGKLIQPLNKTYLPTFTANAWPEVQDPYYDKGSLYTAPYTVYSTGIGYRNDLVSEDIAGMDNPYDILWDTKYKGQIHLLNGARDTLSAALFRMGADISTADSSVLDQAKKMLLDGVDSMGWGFDHTDYNELGRWTIHQTWSGQVSYYQYYLPKGIKITQYSYVWPPKGAAQKPGIVANDVFAIPKGAANPVLAHKMIDFLFDPDNALSNYSYEGFQPPIIQWDPDKAVSDGLVPANLRNTLVERSDYPLGHISTEVQEYELSPTTNQTYEQIYLDVTGGA